MQRAREPHAKDSRQRVREPRVALIVRRSAPGEGSTAGAPRQPSTSSSKHAPLMLGQDRVARFPTVRLPSRIGPSAVHVIMDLPLAASTNRAGETSHASILSWNRITGQPEDILGRTRRPCYSSSGPPSRSRERKWTGPTRPSAASYLSISSPIVPPA